MDAARGAEGDPGSARGTPGAVGAIGRAGAADAAGARAAGDAGGAMRPLAAALLAALLAWRGGLAAWDVGEELATGGWGSPSLPLDARLERTIGADALELVRALRATPADARVLFLGRRSDVEAALAFTHAQVLVYPRRLHHLEGLPEAWDPRASSLDARVHAVAWGELREADLAPFFERAAEGRRFRVWRFRGEEG